ncbi:hypothetical protein ACSSVY_002310 [Roseovarius sp. MBR-51]|uniref:hypothetical protein n=1 Tax=Roseovarius mucosus TaxID=215743 RepID=UPI003F72573C
MPNAASRIGAILDVAATVALVASFVLLIILFADLFTPPFYTDGFHLGYFAGLAKATTFLGLMLMPTICCAIAWPIYIRQKRRGQPVFGWLRFVVLVSAAWTWFVFVALNGL